MVSFFPTPAQGRWAPGPRTVRRGSLDPLDEMDKDVFLGCKEVKFHWSEVMAVGPIRVNPPVPSQHPQLPLLIPITHVEIKVSLDNVDVLVFPEEWDFNFTPVGARIDGDLDGERVVRPRYLPIDINLIPYANPFLKS